MNEVLRVIKERYSCRNYKNDLPDKDKLDAIALAGVQSPSAMNRQPWEILIITDKNFIDEMDTDTMKTLAAQEDKSTYERIMSRGGKVFYNAPCMYLILKHPIGNFAALDCGIVSENIALAASSLELGNVICAMANIPFSGSRGAEFKKKVGWSDDLEFGMAVLVGYAQESKEPHEVDMNKIRYI
ncbi:MAG: nitroreductase family protein [Defluviitaleaceae bacterium]|nr:nitroreductase family protein [Defluviitaleaceae bacterium]